MKRYSAETFLGILREIVFPNSSQKLREIVFPFTSVNDAYSDFIYRLVGAINFIAPAKRIRVKGNSKPWFDCEIVSAT